jgi:hypothetical protein
MASHSGTDFGDAQVESRRKERKTRRRGWLSDFEFRRGRLTVIKTGATARIDWSVLFEVAVWLIFYTCLQIRVAWFALRRKAGPSIGFLPDIPRPWYLVRSAAAWSGMRVVPSGEADIVMHFDDATWCGSQPVPAAAVALNFACLDISKSRVATVFEAVFGYPLAVDPRCYEGVAVEKGEINSMHDGRLLRCPTTPRDGYVYQRLVDTSDGKDIQDLRTPCVDGQPVLVWDKRRRASQVFSVHNRKVRLRRPTEVFSTSEIEAIGKFCRAFGLDWGGLDILRDRVDGRIYIVDVNKTDVGPAIALPLWHKFRSIGRLAAALQAVAPVDRRGTCE